MNKLTLEFKAKVLNSLIEESANSLAKAKDAYNSALAQARSDDMKSEGKYDTRAIEAGYLASAKKRRTQELESELASFKNLVGGGLCHTARSGSLIKIKDNEHLQIIYLAPYGGSAVLVEGLEVKCLSINSPLGKEILSMEAGEFFELEAPSGNRFYEIIEIL